MRTVSAFSVVLVAGFMGASTVLATAGLSSLALEGQPAPRPGFRYERFEALESSDHPARRVAAIATLISTAKPVRRVTCVLTLDGAGTARVLACTGDAVPGGGTFVNLQHVSMGPTGRVAWDAALRGARGGIFADDLSPVSRVGDPFPTGGVMARASYPYVTATQGIVFKAYLGVVDEDLDEAIVRCVGLTATGVAVPGPSRLWCARAIRSRTWPAECSVT